jgi:putative hydrolase of HD superfamily
MTGQDEIKALGAQLDFLFEMGHLKRVPRSGWALLRVEQPESVAEHSFRTALIAYLLADAEGADQMRALLMALIHDIEEARTSDQNRLAQKYLTEQTDSVRADQLDQLPTAVRESFGRLLKELGEGESIEAQIVRDADRIEGILQALEYRETASGHLVDKWIAALESEISTRNGKAIARAAREATTPENWWLRKMLSGDGDPDAGVSS